MREGDTVNVFDRAVAAVAPVHAAKRAAARAALKIIDSGYGNYGANLTKKSLRGWEFYGGSAKEDIEDNIDILRQRSRDAYMGIPTASAALKTMRTNVIAGGLMPAPQIDAEFLGLTPEDAEKLQAQIVREFALWADTPVCDADRVDNFGVATFLNMSGFRLWGNNTAAYPGNTDPKDRWFSVRRFLSWAANSFILTYFSKVDSPANKRLIEAIVDSENVRGNGFVARGVCARYEVIYDEAENTTADLLDGKITFHQYITPYTPAEDIEDVIEFDPDALTTALS